MQLSNSFGSVALAFLFVIVNISHNGGDCSLCAWKSDISEGLGGRLWANCCTRRRKEELYGVWKCLIEVLSFFLASSCLGCTLQALCLPAACQTIWGRRHWELQFPFTLFIAQTHNTDSSFSPSVNPGADLCSKKAKWRPNPRKSNNISRAAAHEVGGALDHVSGLWVTKKIEDWLRRSLESNQCVNGFPN